MKTLAFVLAVSFPHTAFASTDTLIRRLNDPTKHKVEKAIKAIGNAGAKSAPAVPALMKKLDDDWRVIRYGAAEALGKIGPAAKKAVPRLREMTGEEDGVCRIHAAEALLKIDRKGQTRFVVGVARGELTRAAAEGYKSRWWLRIVLDLLIETGKHAAPAKPELEKVIKAGIDEGRVYTIMGVIDPKRAVRIQLKRLKNEDYRDRNSAIGNLSALSRATTGAVDSMIVDPLIRVLEDPNGDVRWEAARALGGLKNPPRKAVPVLMRTVAHKRNLLNHLWSFGPAAVDAVPMLLKMARDPKGKHRGQAMSLLLSMGDAGKEVVPIMMEALADPDAGVRNGAESSLKKTRPKELLKALGAMLEHKKLVWRLHAAEKLVKFFPDSPKTVSFLAGAASHPTWQTRRKAASMLGKLGAKAKSAAGALKKLAEDPEVRVRHAAAWARTRLGDRKAKAVLTKARKQALKAPRKKGRMLELRRRKRGKKETIRLSKSVTMEYDPNMRDEVTDHADCMQSIFDCSEKMPVYEACVERVPVCGPMSAPGCCSDKCVRAFDHLLSEGVADRNAFMSAFINGRCGR